MRDLPVATHLARAARHRKVGDALADIPEEWAAVCYFYAAYHLVRHALRSDPVFDDLTALHAIKASLAPEDRSTSAHKGRRGPIHEWGIGELMVLLYRPYAGPYDRLHQASIAVRYQDGLPPGIQPAALGLLLGTIEQAHSGGRLRAIE